MDVVLAICVFESNTIHTLGKGKVLIFSGCLFFVFFIHSISIEKQIKYLTSGNLPPRPQRAHQYYIFEIKTEQILVM